MQQHILLLKYRRGNLHLERQGDRLLNKGRGGPQTLSTASEYCGRWSVRGVRVCVCVFV